MKKKNGKVVAVIVLLCVLCFLCAGCGTDETEVVQESESVEVEIQDDQVVEHTSEIEEEQSENLETEEEAYVLDESDSAIIDSLILADLTVDELRIARNEIYARHGMIFVSEDLAEYFANKDWYDPQVTEVPETDLNYAEQMNVKLITEQEKFKSEDVSILASVYSMEEMRIEDDQLILVTKEDSLCSYISYTESWDYLSTTEISFPIAKDCKWYSGSPLILQEDYSDAIVSSEEEIMRILVDDMEAKKAADENGEPYDTSISVVITVVNQEIVSVYQVAA